MVVARHQARQLLERMQGHRSGILFDLTSRQRERIAREVLHLDSPDHLLGGNLVAWADDLRRVQPAIAAVLYALEHDHVVEAGGTGRSTCGNIRAGLRFELACALLEEGSEAMLRLGTKVFHSTLDGCAVHASSTLQFHCWENLGYALSSLGDPLAAARAFQASRAFSPCAETAAAVRVLAAEALEQGGDRPAAQRLLRASWRDLHGLGRTPTGREILERWRPFLVV